MMKRELTLTDIAGYLDHPLLGQHPTGAICWIDVEFIAQHGISLAGYKPVLRPISDLCEEITEQGYNEGKPFVPIVTMAKVAYNDVGDWGHPIYSGEVYQCSCNGIFYGFEQTDGSFIVCDQTGFPVFSPKQRDLFDLLHRLHFDYRGLIDAGLAVSVHDLKQNPYEAANN